MSTPMDKARESAERETTDRQGRNRAWWEALPMTYRPWEDAERRSLTASDFAQLENEFLEGNPWLRREFSFDKHRGENVLEIGCGAGAATCLFAKAGARVTSVDLTEGAVELTRQNTSSQGYEVTVRQMDAERLDFADASFDFVFSWGVLHHSADTGGALREVSRVLKPGGGALLMVYHRRSLRYWVRGMQWLVLRGRIFHGENLESVQKHFTDGYYHRHYTRTGFARLLRSAGQIPDRMSVTHMGGRMTPGVPQGLDEFVKSRAGWLLVAETTKGP